MNPEMQLLSFLCAKGTLDGALTYGITPEDFLSPSARSLFNYMMDYAQLPDHRGAVPGYHHLTNHFPSFQVCHDESMTVEALCREVRNIRIRKEAKHQLEQAMIALDGTMDPASVLHQTQDQLARTALLDAGRLASTFSASVDLQIARYHHRANGVIVNPILWPWEGFNQITKGIEPDDYILYYGRPKQKKTFVALHHAMDIFRRQHKHVLFYSKEMSEDQIWRRCTAFMANLPYDSFYTGALTPKQVLDLEVAGEEVKMLTEATGGRAQITCISGLDAPGGQDNVAWLTAMVKKYKPDAVFIDGVYLMASTSKSKDAHEKAKEISRMVRDMARRLKVPVIATIQANRKADKSGLLADTDEIAFSDAFGQDATCMLRVVADRFLPICNLILAGSREYKCNGFRINAIPCSNFDFIELLDDDTMKNALAGDEPPPSAIKGKRGRGKKGVPAPEEVSVDDMVEDLE
jgi:replicative DNA helicase